MHARGVLTLVLAVLTLFCPYLPCRDCCAGCGLTMLVESPPEEAIVYCCEHCGIEVDSPEIMSSTLPRELSASKPLEKDCPSPNKVLSCFCGGAVVAAGVDCPDPGDYCWNESLPRLTFPWGDNFSLRGNSSFAFDSGGQFPPTASGRDICALASCFLL